MGNLPHIAKQLKCLTPFQTALVTQCYLVFSDHRQLLNTAGTGFSSNTESGSCHTPSANPDQPLLRSRFMGLS